jgi:hypothetical protein
MTPTQYFVTLAITMAVIYGINLYGRSRDRDR